MQTICLDCRYIRPKPSGIGLVVRELVERLPALAPKWRFLLLRSVEQQTQLSFAENVQEISLRNPANGPVNMWLLSHVVDLSEVDLFHSPSNILPAGLTTATVTTIHDLMWLNNPQLCNAAPWGKVEKLFYQHGIKRALRQSDAIVAVSEATRSDIQDHDPAAGARTTALLPGVSKAFTPGAASADLRRKLGLPEEPYVLTVGQNAPYKNHAGAIRGFAKAIDAATNIQLVMVQRRGPRAGELERLSCKLGVADRVHFVETVEEAALIDLYRGATALLHPSFFEGFGIPILEAMSSGCPVITSDRSAMPEVAGGAALLVDPSDTASIADALGRVFKDRELAETLSQKGLSRAAELSWERFAKGHIEIYRDVLDAT